MRSNAQQEAVALYRFFESRGFRPSVRSIGRALRDQGIVFDDKALRRWLQSFVTAVDPQVTAIPPHEMSTFTATPPQPTATAPRLRAHEIVPLVEIASDPSDPQRRRNQQPRLNLVDPTELEARRILDAFWPLVSERVGSTMTRAAWKSKNKRTALDLVKARVPIERIIAAHAELSRERGDCIYTLNVVQNALTRAGSAISTPATRSDRSAVIAAALERGRTDTERRIAAERAS
jgi:hypothetical protein